MRLKFLVDMNLSPQWVAVLWKHGWQAVHWSTLGDPGASDRDIMDWASVNGGDKVGRVGGRLLSIGDLIVYRLPSFIGL